MSINKMELIFIIILINGFGDGLAEPIGIRFGKHKYETRALFTKRKYTRSLEGSACVFIAGLLAVILFSSSFSTGQFILALLAIPILMTLAEAFSPHSWDNAFLFLVGEILLFVILETVI
jgi:phytol kinase